MQSRNEGHPIPVVFSLATWTHRQSLTAWLVEELRLRYLVPGKIAEEWIQNANLQLLLDGLDEVRPDLREACVRAINGFCSVDGKTGIVICSRIATYEALATKCSLNGSVLLKPFTNEHVNDILARAGDQFTMLRTLLDANSDLRELTTSPLMISVMIVVVHKWLLKAVQEMATTPTAAQSSLKERLLSAYVETIFGARSQMERRYSREQTMRALSWLARTMLRNGLTVLGLRQLSRAQRFQAWLNGDAPWNIAHFLDYCVELSVLRKLGEDYMFVHSILLAFFAEWRSVK